MAEVESRARGGRAVALRRHPWRLGVSAFLTVASPPGGDLVERRLERDARPAHAGFLPLEAPAPAAAAVVRIGTGDVHAPAAAAVLAGLAGLTALAAIRAVERDHDAHAAAA